jgi:hypothetical protein
LGAMPLSCNYHTFNARATSPQFPFNFQPHYPLMITLTALLQYVVL